MFYPSILEFLNFRILDAETNNISEDCGISRIEDVSYNAISVYWHPTQVSHQESKTRNPCSADIHRAGLVF